MFFHSVLIRVQIWAKSNDFVANSGNSVAFSAYSARFGSTFGSLFGCNRGIRAILVTFGTILDSIRIAIRLYWGMPKIDSGQFLAILLDSELIRDIFVFYSGSSPNQRRIRSESTESFRFRLYSGRIGPIFFGRIRFWCNPCKDRIVF